MWSSPSCSAAWCGSACGCGTFASEPSYPTNVVSAKICHTMLWRFAPYHTPRMVLVSRLNSHDANVRRAEGLPPERIQSRNRLRVQGALPWLAAAIQGKMAPEYSEIEMRLAELGRGFYARG